MSARNPIAALLILAAACSSGSSSSTSAVSYAGTWEIVAIETLYGWPPIQMEQFGPVRVNQEGIVWLGNNLITGTDTIVGSLYGRGALRALERSPARTFWIWDSIAEPRLQQEVELELRPNPDVTGELLFDAMIATVAGERREAWRGVARLARQQ